jgi:UDP-glucose 4-epimerase
MPLFCHPFFTSKHNISYKINPLFFFNPLSYQQKGYEMAKKVLVVGGAGYIGSMVNKMLHEASYETVVFDNLSSGQQKNVQWGAFVKGDINNPKDLKKLFSMHHFDAVMHFAALIDVGESALDPSKYYQTNVAGTLNLIQTMLAYGVNFFIFSSTAAVYGMPQQQIITEDHPKNPINPYGESKLMVEKILEDFDKAYGLKSARLRYFNAAGGDPDRKIENYHQKKSNLIPIVLNALQNNLPITINGIDYPTPDGTCIRDYIHIYDLATAHISAMERLFKMNESETYNLGNGNGYSVRQVIKAAEIVTKKSVPIIEGPRRPGDPPYLLANSSKAKSLLNWLPKYPTLESMISHQGFQPWTRAKGQAPLHSRDL